MGDFKSTTVWGGGIMAPPSNFIISSSIMIKFGVLIEFDKFAQNHQKNRNDSHCQCFTLEVSIKANIGHSLQFYLQKSDPLLSNRVAMTTIQVTDEQNLYFWLPYT